MSARTGTTSNRLGISFPLLVGILASFGDDAVNTAVMPMMASLSAAFPSIPYTDIVWIYTMPKIIIIPFALLSGYLAGRKIKFKTLALIGMGIISVAGVAPVLFDDFWMILGARMVLAVGLGLQAPIGPALVMRFFEDGKRRSFVLGLGNGMLNTYSILTGMAVGLLCSIDWRLSFWAYAGMALLFLATLFFLKEPPLPSVDIAVASKQNHEVLVSGNGKKTAPLPVAALVLCLVFAAVDCAWMPVSLNMSSILSSRGWGDAAAAAFLLNLISISGLVAGVMYGRYCSLTKRYNLAVSMFLMMLALLLLFLANGVVMIGLGLFLGGSAFCLLVCGVQNELGFICAPTQMAMATAMFMVFEHLGGFASSWYMAFVMGVFGANAYLAPVGVSVILFGLGAVGFAFYAHRQVRQAS